MTAIDRIGVPHFSRDTAMPEGPARVVRVMATAIVFAALAGRATRFEPGSANAGPRLREGDVGTPAAARPLRYVGHLTYTSPPIATAAAL